MTLYQRLLVYYNIDRFRFKEHDRNKIGVRLVALYKELHPADPMPPRVESIEDSGTYMVIDYPDSFVCMIDQMLRNVHQEILDAAKERRREKEMVVSATLTTLPKIRKRIPIRQKAK